MRRNLTFIAGDSSVGKTSVCCRLAAEFTQGTLDGDTFGTPTGVVFLSAEDGVADALYAKLHVAGADADLVAVLDESEEFASYTRDCERLGKFFEQNPQFKVLVVDTVADYLGSVDENRNTSIRQSLQPLLRMTREHDLYLLAIAHFGKGSGKRSTDMILTSKAFFALARSCLYCLHDPDSSDGRRAVVHVKSSLTAPAEAIAYRMEGVDVDWDSHSIGCCAWDTEPVDIDNLQQWLDAAPGGRKETTVDRAEALLDALVQPGQSRSAEAVMADMQRAGFSSACIYRCRDRLGIKSDRASGTWYRLSESTEKV